MKRILHLCMALAMILCFVPFTVFAEEYSDEYYRIYDYNEHLSESEVAELDSICLGILRKYSMDVTAVGLDSERLGSDTLEEYGKYEYDTSEFGYGNTKDGMIFVWNTETDEMDLVAFGKAVSYLTEEKESTILQELAKMGHTDAYAVYSRYTTLAEELYGNTSSNGYVQQLRIEEKPEWYPEDTTSFVQFHNEDADRLVDAADIFTEEEEAQLRTTMETMRNTYGKDVVIYTDGNSYGMEHSTLAADFYDYCGYGIGEDYEGIILLICMDPSNRGYYITTTGPKTRALHTYSNSQRLDDGIYSYLRSGDYEIAASEWLRGVDDMFRTGIAFAPDWYPELGSDAVRKHNSEISRVYDQQGYLSADEKAELEARIKDLQDRYGVDFVIVTAEDMFGMSDEEYLDAFYRGCGYGFNDTFDGYGLLLRTTFNYSEVMSFGNAKALNDTNTSRMETRVGIESGTYNAATLWLDMQESFLKKGRVPHGSVYWSLRALFGAIAGLIFGGTSLTRARKKMKAEAADPSAERYLADSRFGHVRSRFLTQVVTKRIIKTEDSSRSGGSSGGASYSSSYSGSSGVSHTGSGRGF